MKPFAKLWSTIVEIRNVIMILHFYSLSLVPMSLARLIPYLALSIKRRRERLNKSHEQLADETGFSPEYLAFIETGGTNFSMKTLSTIAEALRLPPSELIEDAEKLSEEDPDPVH
jgi:DNA-binding XRE family transcriptional regulator